MQILPIISTLRRHRTAAVLIVVEIALTCAIVCNAIFLIKDRLERMDRPSGIVESELVRVKLAGVSKGSDPGSITKQDMAAMRAIPGVKLVAATNMIPFGQSSWNTDVSNIPNDPNRPINVAMYMGSPDYVEVLGINMIAGRDFTPDEYVEFEDVQSKKVTMASVIVSKHVAERLFPGQSPLGKQLYFWDDTPQVIVGVYERLARPNEFGSPEKHSKDFSMIIPIDAKFDLGGQYLLRVDPARAQEVISKVDAALDSVDPNRVILARNTYDEIRSAFFKTDRSMAWLLFGVCVALLIITALGVIGLASFWVQQRTRQIGIRRALGATRGDILRYFQTENFILATIGIVLGMALAYGINLWLMHEYQVPRLPAEFLPIGALLLWMLGQIAVLGPALRASMIPPAIATRTV